MDTAKAEMIEFNGLKDLKPLLNSAGPCVSVYMALAGAPTNQSVKANGLAWEQTLRIVEPKLKDLGAEGREMLETLSGFDGILQDHEPQGRSIAVFRSPGAFWLTWMQEEVANRAVVGPHFYIRPLLPELAKPKKFYILALSQKDVRLLHCTFRTSEEVGLPSGTVAGFDGYMNTAKPDHDRNNLSSAGPSSGHSKGAVGTTDTEREDKHEYLGHFFQQIDRGVNELLRGSSDPVILAAVEYELAQYRSLNTYPHLLDEDVHGAPNGLKAGEMHARAIEAITRNCEKKADEVLAEYNHKVGGGASNRLKDVLTAAHDGRVLTLLVSDSLEKSGTFDERTHSVKGHPADAFEEEDLINDAAVQTILHAGQVLSVSNKKMPNGAPLAAIFRY
ncbi:MAG: hypothetical protein M3Y72_09420 [Acidobacteriota bacterium]|nr:hypothetical protein [Acidobacteriota bacterium]